LAPVGDFEIQTRLLFTPIELFHEAGLIVYRDDDNYLLLVRSYPCSQPSSPPCVGNGIYFYHVEHDSNIDRIFTMTTSAPGEAYLRIVRHGRDYTGYVSSDGASWIALGTHTVTSGLLLSKIGLIADNGHTYATEIPADFDFFTLIDHSQRLYLPLIIK
jgi:beta-xylosidase